MIIIVITSLTQPVIFIIFVILVIMFLIQALGLELPTGHFVNDDFDDNDELDDDYVDDDDDEFLDMIQVSCELSCDLGRSVI